MRPGLRVRRRRRIGRWLALLSVIVAVAGGLWVLGRQPEDRPAQTAPDAAGRGARAGGDGPDAAPARPVSLRITATRPLGVCVIDARGRERVDRRRLPRGRSTPTIRSARFHVALDGGAARLRIDGRVYRVSARARRTGFIIRPGAAPRRLAPRRLPDCR